MSNFGHINSNLSIFGNATRAAGRHQQPTSYIRWHQPMIQREQDSSLLPVLVVGGVILFLMMRQ